MILERVLNKFRTHLVEKLSKERKFKVLDYKDVIWEIVCLVLLSGVLIMDIYVVSKYLYGRLQSDLSSEMILARLLSKEHKWITASWFYSTELRVVAIAPLYAVCFLFTDNWQTVRIMGAILMYLILSVCVFYFCVQLSPKGKKIAPLCALSLLIPISSDRTEILLLGMYYTPQVAFSFMSMGLLLQSVKVSSDNRTRFGFILIIQGIIAFLSGLGGMRMLILLYGPMFICTFFFRSKDQRLMICGVTNCILGGIGYAINIFLKYKGILHYSTYLRTKLTIPSINSILKLLYDLLVNLGLSAANIIYLIPGIFLVILALVGFVGIFVMKKDKDNEFFEYKFTGTYLFISFLIFLMIYLFTNMDYAGRYNLQFIVYIIPLSLLWWYEKGKEYLVAIMILLLLIVGIRGYSGIHADGTMNEKYQEIEQYLVKNDYTKGYASYWNGNLLTELSNGKIEVWDICAEGVSSVVFPGDGEVQVYEWLQETRHVEQEPVAPFFVLLNDLEYDEYINDRNLYDEHMVFKTQDLRLYIFD